MTKRSKIIIRLISKY